MTNDTKDPLQSQPEKGSTDFSVQMQPGNYFFAKEPDLKEEKAQILKSQVPVPCSNSSHAYLGPIEKTENEKTKEIFP